MISYKIKRCGACLNISDKLRIAKSENKLYSLYLFCNNCVSKIKELEETNHTKFTIIEEQDEQNVIFDYIKRQMSKFYVDMLENWNIDNEDKELLFRSVDAEMVIKDIIE